ncbi:hypothetical protein [Planococcus shixiaomingii]|uniref:hypothetical protein n=1 Tax=Planococcus shixiaomingii TaxID=3058393 RepID=UPI002605A8ED|nr:MULTISPECIES: hypothetical protein [unclassified Planococcus (in: firmicutes)]WKA53461.1 hypothetical protein QWY21_12400 [Planococcus sp. N022]
MDLFFSQFDVILYFLLLWYGPWILLLLSFFYFVRAWLKLSTKLLIISFLLFLPDLLILMFVEIEPVLYFFFAFPASQVLLYFDIRRELRKKVNSYT